MEKVLMIGASGLAREVLTLAHSGTSHVVFGVLDDDWADMADTFAGVPVLGSIERAVEYVDIKLLVCVGSGAAREKIVERLAALEMAIELVRRGGTVSVVGVYGGMTDPMPMMKLFDKQVQIRMGQANVRRWVDDLLPLVVDDDVLGAERFATHHVPLDDAPKAYEMFREKQDGAVKVLFNP